MAEIIYRNRLLDTRKRRSNPTETTTDFYCFPIDTNIKFTEPTIQLSVSYFKISQIVLDNIDNLVNKYGRSSLSLKALQLEGAALNSLGY